MKVKARLKHLKMSPRKVRLVADLIRNLRVDRALEQLSGLNKRATRPILKLLNSAIANAENNFFLDKKSLKISEITVDGGPILKRYMPRARGRATMIQKRTSHVTLVLEGQSIQKKEKEKHSDKKKEELPVVKREDISSENIEKEKPKKVNKKIGKEKKPSFVKKIFRRKSI